MVLVDFSKFVTISTKLPVYSKDSELQWCLGKLNPQDSNPNSSIALEFERSWDSNWGLFIKEGFSVFYLGTEIMQ